ncbi:MAG: hypothetical protein WCC17_23295 [Candidatus Nitrosopolaris sp.]
MQELLIFLHYLEEQERYVRKDSELAMLLPLGTFGLNSFSFNSSKSAI